MAVLIDKNRSTLPRLFGGTQQFSRRPGTESAAMVAAAALTVELALREEPQRARGMRFARDAFVTELGAEGLQVLTPEHSLPNTVMILFEDIDGRQLLPALDMAGLEASQGSACSSGSPTPPAVLNAMGLSESACRACVRFSFSHDTSATDAASGARVVKRVLRSLRQD
jgi:cysteine desulfurase